jgi:hypothetical protein
MFQELPRILLLQELKHLQPQFQVVIHFKLGVLRAGLAVAIVVALTQV